MIAEAPRTAQAETCTRCGVAVTWRLDALPGGTAVGGDLFAGDDLPPLTTGYRTEGCPAWATDLRALPAKARQ